MTEVFKILKKDFKKNLASIEELISEFPTGEKASLISL